MDFLIDRIKKLKVYQVPSADEGEIKLDAMENPYPLPEIVINKICSSITRSALNRYPDASYRSIRKLIAEYSDLKPENVLIGNGSDELIQTVLLACGGAGRSVGCPEPTFSMYRILAELTGTEYAGVHLDKDFELNFHKLLALKSNIIFIAYPNNPTGNCFSARDIDEIIRKSGSLVIVDEAYYEFSGKTFAGDINKYENLAVMRTFSKAFSLAGVRAGYMLANSGLIKNLRKVQLPYNISAVNQKIIETALREKNKILATVIKLKKSRADLYSELSGIRGIKAYKSEANFILMKIKRFKETVRALKADKINVREFSDAGLKNYLRVTVGTEEENEKFIQTLKKAARE